MRVCVRPQLSRALSYVIRLLCHCTIATSAVELLGVCRLNRPAKVRKAILILCCLDGERVVGNDDNSSSDRYYTGSAL